MANTWADFKDTVKASVNLKDLVEEYTVLTPIGSNIWSGRCPHPDHEDKTPSFRVYKNKNNSWSFKCFGCQDIHEKKGENNNYGSDCFAFLQWMSDYKGSKKVLTFMEALTILAEKEGIPKPAINNEYESLFNSNEKQTAMAEQNMLPNVTHYLVQRGLDYDDIKQWRIGCLPFKESNKTILRIVFPLFNRQKRIVGFSSRLLKEQEDFPKYVNSSNSAIFQKRNYLYGQHLLNLNNHDIIVTEGQFDVILAVKYGLPNVTAVLGSSFTEEHAAWIKKQKMAPTFIFDHDPAGVTAVERAIKICKEKELSANVCMLPIGQDLAEVAVTLKDILPEWIVNHTVPAWRYLLEDTAIRYDAALNNLRQSLIPRINMALPVNQDDQILMKSFVKERFGIFL